MAKKVGEEGGEKNGGRIEPDEIVERVVRNPANPEVRRLVGLYLGKGLTDEHWRLYLNDSFSHYLEFRKEDTLDAQRVSSGKLVVWVKPESKVRETRSQTGAVEFVNGSILNSNIGAIRDLGAGGARQVLGLESAGCSAASCFTTAGPNCRGPNTDTIGYTCGCDGG
jgi:hypothetical protein